MAKRCPTMDSKEIVDTCMHKVHDKIKAMLPCKRDLRRTVKNIQKKNAEKTPVPVSPTDLKDLGAIPEDYAMIGNFTFQHTEISYLNSSILAFSTNILSN